MSRKRILLKLTGSAFLPHEGKPSGIVVDVIQQIKTLVQTHQFGIVVGGGNFFRGAQEGKQFQLTPSTGHHVGMLATMMNGLILRDIAKKEGLPVSLFSAVVCPGLITPARPCAVEKAQDDGNMIIFSGGTGLPFFTTDTNAAVRALQMEAEEIWKATDTDGLYDDDPAKNKNAQLIKNTSHEEVLKKGIKVMDAAAFALAKQHKLTIRVFNIFEPNALLHVTKDATFGSKIS